MSKLKPPSRDGLREATRLAWVGRDPSRQEGFVNPPTYRGSTVLFDDVADMRDATRPGWARYRYGLSGTPTSRALEEAMTELEGGYRSVIVSSGLSAITIPLMAFLKAGDHALVVDSCYDPTRAFCDRVLAPFGVEITYYAPELGAGIEALVTDRTRVILMESPGSLTFEMQDVPAIVEVAQRHEIVTIFDNTWGSPLFYRPIEQGIDVSAVALTKYVGGHADLLAGVIVCRTRELFMAVKRMASFNGNSAGVEEMMLSLRGLRTVGVRLRQQQENALTVAHWLAERPEVEEVLYPALPGAPGHEIWKRDFSGAASLFGVILRPVAPERVEAMIDALQLFGLGFSWGGYESLATLSAPEAYRNATTWRAPGRTIRLHVGLEDPADLIADLDQALVRLTE